MKQHPPAIVLDRVSRTLTDEAVPVTLVKNASFSINRGEFVSITGPSGSGKSSLIYLMGLLDQPTDGTVTIDGIDTTHADTHTKEMLRLQSIGFVFQFHFLLPEFSALDNVTLPMRKLAKLSPKDIRERGLMLLNDFGLNNHAHKKPHQLSGGERQRVAIARALANNPLLIIADEPTGNLDTKNSAKVFEIFEKLVREEHKTIIMVTHDVNLAERSQRQIHIVDGQVLNVDTARLNDYNNSPSSNG